MTGPRFLVLLPPPRTDRRPITWRRTPCQGMFCLNSKKIWVLRHFFSEYIIHRSSENSWKSLKTLIFLSVATRKNYKYKVHNQKCLKIETCKNKTIENKTRLDPQHSPYKFNRHWQFFNRTPRRLFRFQCYWTALQQFSWIKWNRLRVSSQNKLKAQYLKTASSLTMLRKHLLAEKIINIDFLIPFPKFDLDLLPN